VFVDGQKSVTAVFAQVDLTVDKDGEGQVSVSPPGGVQSLPYTGTYGIHTPVNLAATPSSAWVFDQWEGDVPSGSENNNPLNLPMDDDTAVTAVFLEEEFWISDPDPTGSIDSPPGVTEIQTYPGTLFQLSASDVEDWDTFLDYDFTLEQHVESQQEDTASIWWIAQVGIYSNGQGGQQVQFTAPNTIGTGTVTLHALDGRDASDPRADTDTEVDSILWANLVPTGETVVWADHFTTNPHWGDEFSHRLLPTTHSFFGMTVKEKLEFVSSSNPNFDPLDMVLGEGAWTIDQNNWRNVTDKHAINPDVHPYNILAPGENVIVRKSMYVTSNDFATEENGPFYVVHDIEFYVYLDGQQRRNVGVNKGGVQAP
jgi:hypothetical protein